MESFDGTGADGGFARLAHNPRLPRDGVPDDDLRDARRGMVRGDAVALGLAQRWAKVSAVLFAIGAVSGTVLSFEMGLLWPGLMGRFGDVLGLPFAFEGLSFFVEAIFLGIYLYGWNRMPPRRHLAMLIPMGAAGVIGTLQFAHMWVGAFMLVGFVVFGDYVAGMLRGRRDEHHRLGFNVGFRFATVAALVQPLIGHVLGLRAGDTQPSRLAAFQSMVGIGSLLA